MQCRNRTAVAPPAPGGNVLRARAESDSYHQRESVAVTEKEQSPQTSDRCCAELQDMSRQASGGLRAARRRGPFPDWQAWFRQAPLHNRATVMRALSMPQPL